MSDTPRTDAFEDGRIGSPLDPDELRCTLEFARGLERELSSIRRLTHDEVGAVFDSIPKGILFMDGVLLFAERLQDAIFKDAT